MTSSTKSRFVLPALILGNIFLSFGPWLVREADTGPIASAFWRTALATPVLLLIAVWVTRRDPNAAKAPPIAWGIFALSGLMFAADLASWHLGIERTKLANSNLMGNSTSFLLPLWAFFAARQLPSRQQAGALGLALAGVVLLMGRSYELSPQNLVGDLFCMLAGAFYTVYIVMMAGVRETQNPWRVLAHSTLMTPLPLLVFAWFAGETIWPQDWRPLLTLALSSQIIGQGLLTYVIGRVTPLVMGMSLLLQPIVSAALGWISYGETLSLPDWIGATLIALALVLVSAREAK